MNSSRLFVDGMANLDNLINRSAWIKPTPHLRRPARETAQETGMTAMARNKVRRADLRKKPTRPGFWPNSYARVESTSTTFLHFFHRMPLAIISQSGSRGVMRAGRMQVVASRAYGGEESPFAEDGAMRAPTALHERTACSQKTSP